MRADEQSLEIDGDEEDDDAAEGSGDKNSHRAIPAWEEAIGYIVSVNMESRAKNPVLRNREAAGAAGDTGAAILAAVAGASSEFPCRCVSLSSNADPVIDSP